MVGTLKEIGVSSKPPKEIAEILNLKNRKHAGITAPPEGLTLKKVLY